MRLRIAFRSPSHSFRMLLILSRYLVLIALFSAMCSSSSCIRRLDLPSKVGVVGALDLFTVVGFCLSDGISSRLNVEISAGGTVEDADIVYCKLDCDQSDVP